MLNIIKKTCIAALFLGCILFPMDPPTKKAAPISIITLLDANIQHFSKEVAALGDKIIRAKSHEHLKQRLESEKSELQKLLGLNESFKQQWQDHLDRQLQEHQQLPDNWYKEQKRKDDEFDRLQDRFNTEMGKVSQEDPQLASFIAGHHERVDHAIDRAASLAQEQILRELQEENKRITESAKLMDTIQDNIQNLVDATKAQYEPEIERTNEEIARLELDKKKLEIKRDRINRIGYSMCAGIAVFMISTACILRYFYPQGLFQ